MSLVVFVTMFLLMRLSRQNATSAARPQIAAQTNTIDVRTMSVLHCKRSCLMAAASQAANRPRALNNRKIKSSDRGYRSKKTIDYRRQDFSSILN
jgi:hypothetical protein